MFPVNSISVSYGVLFVWQLCSIIWSPAASDSFLIVLTTSLLLLAVFLGFQLNTKQKNIMTSLLILLGIVVASYTCYQALILKVSRPSGFFLNWNTNAAFMGMILLPLSARYLLKERLGFGLVISFIIFTITLTISRGALLGLFFGLVLIFSAKSKQQNSLAPLLRLTAWLVFGFFIGNSVLSQFLGQESVGAKLLETIQATQQAITASDVQVIDKDSEVGEQQELGHKPLLKIASGRHYLWDAAWRMYQDKPVLGWGIGTYHWLYPQYRSAEYGELGQFAHNDYLQYLMELGPLGLLLILVFTGAVFIQVWRIPQQVVNRPERLEMLGYAAACIAFLIHTGLTFHFYQAAMLIIFGLYLGLMSQDLSTRQFVAKRKIMRQRCFVGLVSLCLLCIVSLGTLFSGFNALPKQQDKISPQQVFINLTAAIQRTPYIEELVAFQSSVLVDLLIEQPKAQSPTQRKALMLYALTLVDQAIASNSLRARNYYNRAQLFSMLPDSPGRQQNITGLSASFNV